MTTETPSPSDMQKLLIDFEERARQRLQFHRQLDSEETYDDALFLANAGLKLASYIRTLEREHREMREYLESVFHDSQCPMHFATGIKECKCGKLGANTLLASLTIK